MDGEALLMMTLEPKKESKREKFLRDARSILQANYKLLKS